MSIRQFVILVWLAVVVMIMVGCSSAEEQASKTITTFWPDGSTKERFEVATLDPAPAASDTMPVKHGIYLSWYQSGNVNKEGQFIHGKKSGDWIFRHDSEDSALMMAGSFVDGAMQGEWRWWMPASHDHDHADKMSAPDDSQAMPAAGMRPPHKLANYDQGLPHGLSMSWHPSGGISDSFSYQHGILDGVYVSYHQNGIKAARGVYSKGSLIDSMQIWDSLGQAVR